MIVDVVAVQVAITIHIIDVVGIILIRRTTKYNEHPIFNTIPIVTKPFDSGLISSKKEGFCCNHRSSLKSLHID